MESEIQSAILAWLKEQNIYSEKMVLGNRSGLPDVRCCVCGVFVAFEVKVPGEKPKPLQAYNLRKIRESGGIGLSVTTLAEVKAVVAAITKKPELKCY